MADPATIASMAEELVKGLQASRSTACVDMAGITIICFDWLLNLDSEIKLVWKAEGKPMKVVYLLVRYVPFVYGISFPFYVLGKYTASECGLLYDINGMMFVIIALFVDFVLTIRTWAVWAKGKYITYSLFGLYAIAVALTFGFCIASLKNTQHFTFPEPLHGCYPRLDKIYLSAAFLVHTVFDTIVLILMLIRGVSLYWWAKDSDLFQTIYSDGISFYVYNVAISIANAVLLSGESNYSILLLMLEGALGPILACRVVLHIRKKYALREIHVFATNGGGMHATYLQRSVIE